MARPNVGPVAESMYTSLGYYRSEDEAFDWPLLRFVAAWTKPLDAIYELGRERDGMPGWAILFDPDNCPAETLPYLAQYVGAILTPEMSEAQQRAEIKQPTTWRRGQPDTYKLAIQRTLTGTQRVVIRQRTPEPHDLYVRVLKAEATNPARTEAVAREEKVGGLLLDFDLFDGLTYADLAAGFETYAAVSEAFATYGDALDSSLPE